MSTKVSKSILCDQPQSFCARESSKTWGQLSAKKKGGLVLLTLFKVQ
jgi:hypothetical protein